MKYVVRTCEGNPLTVESDRFDVEDGFVVFRLGKYKMAAFNKNEVTSIRLENPDPVIRAVKLSNVSGRNIEPED